MKRPPKDPRGGHVRLYWELIDAPPWPALAYSSRALYIDLRRTLGSTNNGNISAALTDLKRRGWNSSATLTKALWELLAVGLIAQTRGGGPRNMSRDCALYRFTDVEAYAHPKLGIPYTKASNDYRRFTTTAEAEEAIRQFVLENARPDPRKKTRRLIQKMKRKTSDSEVLKRINASVSEQETSLPLQNLN